jgi:hypothetical protein
MINLYKSSYDNPLYNTWKDMRKRCENPNRRDYKWYGAKGIEVCSAWQVFSIFAKDMAPTWFKGATIERLNTADNYEKANCCWKTIQQQQKNRSNTPHVKKLEEIKKLRELGLTQQAIGDKLGMHQSTVSLYLSGKASE